ncbi:SOS response-associated peptidase [Caldicellulosiruptor naganoensis]|uniref:Abasic site processing protein n=1 Tax=Caldicellulosiruptor naganoensis TaxID=29324 RepID=A0ABY7BGC9_9FIRM|nr:SOS response-associated peptidase [Caldicellulosiruptor naganoensis]WAM31453.1 SOS response-associated peptidase [Caldicellulosiruptor naganoensis]
MCGRYLFLPDEQIEEIKNILQRINQKFHDTPFLNKLKIGEIFPTELVPVVVAGNDEKDATIARWGFPIEGKKQVIINARAETLLEKWTFKRIVHQRCLIPAVGFYEWKKREDSKQKFLIKPQDRSLFYMAGLYERINLEDGTQIDAFVIITTQPNSQVKPIHDRMPAILKKEHEDLWLFEKGDERKLKKLFDAVLKPYEGEMEIEKVEK